MDAARAAPCQGADERPLVLGCSPRVGPLAQPWRAGFECEHTINATATPATRTGDTEVNRTLPNKFVSREYWPVGGAGTWHSPCEH